MYVEFFTYTFFSFGEVDMLSNAVHDRDINGYLIEFLRG